MYSHTQLRYKCVLLLLVYEVLFNFNKEIISIYETPPMFSMKFRRNISSIGMSVEIKSRNLGSSSGKNLVSSKEWVKST
jgi:hypothetical protein